MLSHKHADSKHGIKAASPSWVGASNYLLLMMHKPTCSSFCLIDLPGGLTGWERVGNQQDLVLSQ